MALLLKKWIQSFFRQPTIHPSSNGPDFSLKTHPNDATLLCSLSWLVWDLWSPTTPTVDGLVTASSNFQPRRFAVLALEDGVDYVPTSKGVVFGHHFTSIAGMGTDRRPRHRRDVGMGPTLLWVVLGSVSLEPYDFRSSGAVSGIVDRRWGILQAR